MIKKNKALQSRPKLSYKIPFGLLLLCVLLLFFYYYCKSQTLIWLDHTGFDVQAEQVYPIFENFRPGIKIVSLTIKSKHSAASLKKISASSLVIKPSLFSFMKLFASYAFDFELNNARVNEQGNLYVEIVRGTGEVAYGEGIYHLNNLMIAPLRFELTPVYSTLEDGKLRKGSTSYSIHLVRFNGAYNKNTTAFKLHLNIPRPINLKSKTEDYTVEARGEGIFIRKSLKEKQHLPIEGNVKFNIERFSNFLDHLRQAQLISSLENNIGSVLGYPISKQKLSSKELEEIMTNAVSLNLKILPEAAYVGVLKIYP